MCTEQYNSVTAVITFTGSAISQYIRPRGSDNDFLACKACQEVCPVLPEVSTRTASSTIILSVTFYDSPLPCSALYNGLPLYCLCRFHCHASPIKNFMPSPVRSSLVATQQYASSPDSRASMVCVDLDAFSSECSRSSDCHSCVWPVRIDRVRVSSADSGVNGQTDMSLQVSWFQPLNHSQVVVESPSHYEAPAVPVKGVNISALVESVVQLSHISALSSVQLSLNRVREDYSYDTMDVFLAFLVSPDIDGYIPATSPVTPPVSGELLTSPATLGSDSLPPGATGSLDSLIGVRLCPGPLSNRQQTCPGRGLLMLIVYHPTLEVTR